MVLRFGVALTVHAVLSMSSEAARLKTKHRKACEFGKKRPRLSQYSILLKPLCLAVAATQPQKKSAECLFVFLARTSAAVADRAHRRCPARTSAADWTQMGTEGWLASECFHMPDTRHAPFSGRATNQGGPKQVVGR